MLNVLVVEDDENKSKQVVTCLHQLLPEIHLEERRSYQSGLKEIVLSKPDLVILDMSMPTFDITTKDKGGRARAYAGRDILDELIRRRLETSAIIVTQYETFGEGSDKKTLEQLKKELTNEFPTTFLGAVYYHPSQSDWKRQLQILLNQFESKRASDV
jgi:CheY-like chemotaxis protein